MTIESINGYCEYFEGELQKIDSRGENLHSRILFVTILDALSRAAHPNLAKKNHDRIIKFIDSCVQWDNRNRISLPQVIYKLENAQLTNGPLYEKANSTVQSWEQSNILGPDVDPYFEDLIVTAQCDCERKALKSSKYNELFYTHRNYLVHEYRNPGDGFIGISSSAEPYYHQNGSKWELVFPVKLLSSFCHDGLIELKSKLTSEARDPYQAYKFESRW